MQKANWVTYPKRVNCCSFIKDYFIDGQIDHLEISITSMGWYHLYIDGKRIDQDVFSPGWTNYKKRVQYQTYTVKTNKSFSLRIDLAEGWGGGDRFAWAGGRYFPYYPLALNYQIKVVLLNGTSKKYYSNSSLKVYENEFIDSTIYYGEQVDFRRQLKYIGLAKKINIDSRLVPQEGPHIIYGEKIKAKELFKDSNGDLIVDFGQNFTGAVEIKIKGKEGEEISYTPGEVIDKEGAFYNLNYRKCKNCVYSFVLSGKEDVFIPQFSFLGGRYIKLIKYPDNVCKENFTAILVHSEMEETSSFECGNSKINRLYLNTKYGQLSNYLDVPTDCPQRDERLGWTGDTQVFCKTGAIHFNTYIFFKKWLHDLIDSQFNDGSINGIVPLVNDGRIISSGWGDVCTVVPYEIYKAFGDKKLLKDCIPMMEKWIDFLSSKYKENKPYIVDLKTSFGDWLALDKKEDKETFNYKGLTDFSLIDTAFYAYSVFILIKCLNVLHINSEKYQILLKNIKFAYQNEFIVNHHMKGERIKIFEDYKKEQSCFTQTGLVLTLYFDLCCKEDKKILIKDLTKLIKSCGNRLTTGFLGTPYLLYALSENKKTNIAYDLLFQEEYPSWLYSVNKGATTMWEHYDSVKPDGSFTDPNMNSFNHYAYGSVFSWIFEYAGGIKLVKPQYKQIIIEPKVDERLGRVNCCYKSKFGMIKSNWCINNNKIKFDIEVPIGIKAKIILPHKKIVVKNGGTIKEETSK